MPANRSEKRKADRPPARTRRIRSRAPAQRPRLAALTTPDPAERKGLELFLRQAPSFRLAFALYDDPLLPAALIRHFSDALAGTSVRLLTLDLATGAQGKTLLAHVEALVKTAALAPGERPAVMLLNLGACIDYTPELPQPGGPGLAFLETANFHRELFPAASPGPFIIWATETLETAIVRHAPDLWHWRSHTFDLRTRRHQLPDPTPEQLGLPSSDFSLHPQLRIPRLLEELDAYRKAASAADEARVLNSLGIARRQAGDARHARLDFEAALAIVRQAGDRRTEGYLLGNLGTACAELGDLGKAIDFFEQALAIAREIGDRRGEGNALGNLGIAHTFLGEPRKAIEFHEQALAIAREIGDRRGEGNALGSLGNAHTILGDPRKATEFHEQSLVIAREIGNRRGEGSALGNLGNAHSALGDPRKAIDCYDQQLAIAREIGDRRGEAAALFNSAGDFDKLGQRDEALERVRAALALYEAIGAPQAEKARQLIARLSAPEP